MKQTSLVKMSLADQIAGEDLSADVLKVEQRYGYSNITTATTTTIKSGAGFLHAITIMTPVANSVITIYDNTAASGNKIGTITLPAAITNQGPISVPVNVSFTTGLTVVTATAASDLTVSYR
jgi:hypothetical protein